jgi:hypothetical protein
MQDITTRTGDEFAQQYKRLADFGLDLRVACPAIVQTVDYEKQTLTAIPAIREKMNDGQGNLSWVEIPLLLDVPFFVYSGGGYCLTLPIKTGDDCLIVFGDNCMDAWWQNGGIQNQVESRRHDLSDGFAIVGFRSQPAVVSGYSAGTAQLRNKAGDAYVEIAGSTINIVGGAVNISAGSVNIGGSTTIDGKPFLPHTHGGVLSGPDNTGGVS